MNKVSEQQGHGNQDGEQAGGTGAGGGHEHGKFYVFFVDDREFHFDQQVITGAKVMELAGIPKEVGLNLIEEDGTQRPVQPDESIELKPGRRFKKAPRFKRG